MAGGSFIPAGSATQTRLVESSDTETPRKQRGRGCSRQTWRGRSGQVLYLLLPLYGHSRFIRYLMHLQQSITHHTQSPWSTRTQSDHSGYTIRIPSIHRVCRWAQGGGHPALPLSARSSCCPLAPCCPVPILVVLCSCSPPYLRISPFAKRWLPLGSNLLRRSSCSRRALTTPTAVQTDAVCAFWVGVLADDRESGRKAASCEEDNTI